MTRLAFLDTETTGLDPDRHEVWEVGLILREDDGSERGYVWQLPVDLGRADAMALQIGQWYERRWPWPHDQRYVPDDGEKVGVKLALEAKVSYVIPEDYMEEWAALFANLTDGCHLVGAVISFDEERLRRLLRKHHACPTWHYHIIDVEALAAGWLAAGYDFDAAPAAPEDKCRPPWDSEELSRAVGVDSKQFDRHTALGDAQWARAIYDAVMGIGAS